MLFQLQSHSQEDQLATIHRQDVIVKIPETGCWNIPLATETKKNHIRRVWFFDCITPSPGLTERASQGPVEKREAKVDIRLSQYCRMLSGRRRSYLMKISGGNLWNTINGDQIKLEKEGRVFSNQHSDLGRLCSCLQRCLNRNSHQQLFPSEEPSWWPHLAMKLKLAVSPKLDTQPMDCTGRRTYPQHNKDLIWQAHS